MVAVVVVVVVVVVVLLLLLVVVVVGVFEGHTEPVLARDDAADGASGH